MVDRYLLANLTGEPLKKQLLMLPQDQLIDVAMGFITQWSAIQHAAHMPDDYKYGLPSWINQVLYANYVGAALSPDIFRVIEDTMAIRMYQLNHTNDTGEQVKFFTNQLTTKMNADQKIELFEHIKELMDDFIHDVKQEQKNERSGR